MIEMSLDIPARYRKHLIDPEVPTTEMINIKFSFKNIGTSTIKEAVVKEISARWEEDLESSNKEIFTIKELKPNQSVSNKWNLNFKLPGLCWVKTNIEFKNLTEGDTIKYFQSAGSKLELDKWQNVIVVVDRLNLDTINNLADIKKTLKQLVRKIN